MNKKVLFAAFAVVFAALSCSKEAEPVDNTQEPEATVPQQGVLVPYTITAGAPPTKTAIDGSGNVVWSADDAIKVYYDGGSAVSSEIELASGGASATFTVMLPEGMATSDKLYAVYPATTDASLSGSTFSIVVPEEQTGKFEDVNIVVAATTVGEHTLSFKQVLSFVNFTVSAGNPKAITRALFRDLYGTAIVGTLPVSFDESGNATPGVATSTGTEVSLTAVQEGKNYIAVLPGVALQSIGLKLGSSSAWFTPIASDNDVTIDRGHTKPLGTVDTKVSDAFYVKESASGTGDGTSWANAAGASALTALVHTGSSDGYPRKAAMFRLPGFSIKLAAGTYAPEAITCQFGHDDGTVDGYVTIEGGFDADGTANSSAKATISGSNSHRILAVSNGVGLTLKKLIFSGGRLTSGEGAAIRASSSTLVIEDCVFSSNVSAADGGALYYNTWGHPNYALTVIGTTFGGETSSDANQAKAGSAIWIVQSNSASISNCIFKNNNATTLHDPQFGTVAITGNAQGVSIADCRFLSNTGGAIDVSSTTTSGYVAINGCRFEDNKTSYRGASIWVPGLLPVYVNNCVFKNEKGARRGISIALDSATSGKSGKMGINNCTFDHGSINKEGGDGTYETSLPNWIGEVWLSGKAILSNSTIVGEGVHGSLNQYYSSYGNPGGSVVVNNVITTENMKDYIWRLFGTTFSVQGYYNVYSGDYSHWISKHDDSDIRSDSSVTTYWTSYWSPVADANGHYDYSIPSGKTVTKIPSLAEVRSAIATHEFGSSFIAWLDSVDGLTKDASGTSRTDANNRQGALAKK